MITYSAGCLKAMYLESRNVGVGLLIVAYLVNEPVERIKIERRQCLEGMLTFWILRAPLLRVKIK